jgi:hypothetical protein
MQNVFAMYQLYKMCEIVVNRFCILFCICLERNFLVSRVLTNLHLFADDENSR